MLVFLGGIDLPGLIIVLVIMALVGTGIFYLIRPLVRKLFKSQPGNIINAISRLAAFILTPALFVLIIYLVVLYFSYSDGKPHVFTEEEVAQHYEMMESDLNSNLKIGMSKTDALAEFALEDTTQSEYEIDLSLPDVEEEYVLKLKFEKGKLSSFERAK
jgi:hypothetical protein